MGSVGLFLFSQTTVPCQETASMLLSCDIDKRLVKSAKSHCVYIGCLGAIFTLLSRIWHQHPCKPRHVPVHGFQPLLSTECILFSYSCLLRPNCFHHHSVTTKLIITSSTTRLEVVSSYERLLEYSKGINYNALHPAPVANPLCWYVLQIFRLNACFQALLVPSSNYQALLTSSRLAP